MGICQFSNGEEAQDAVDQLHDAEMPGYPGRKLLVKMHEQKK
jgi:hypothetical protein